MPTPWKRFPRCLQSEGPVGSGLLNIWSWRGRWLLGVVTPVPALMSAPPRKLPSHLSWAQNRAGGGGLSRARDSSPVPGRVPESLRKQRTQDGVPCLHSHPSAHCGFQDALALGTRSWWDLTSCVHALPLPIHLRSLVLGIPSRDQRPPSSSMGTQLTPEPLN